MPNMKRIERDPETGEYEGYEPRDGDLWVFGERGRWALTAGLHVFSCGPESRPNLHDATDELRALTSHIERPVRAVTVPKEGYVPREGDRLCGPEGVVMTFVRPYCGHLWVLRAAGTSFGIGDYAGLRGYVALCHHIERDEA